MTISKRQLLEDTYQKFLQVGINETIPLKTIDSILVDDINGFGTTADERVFSKSEFYSLIERQREQSKGLNIKWQITPIVHRVSKDGNSAVFTNDATIKIDVPGEPIEMDLRFTVVLEFQDKKWFVVHWHTSKPEYTQSQTDTWGINKWKQKTIELEKIVTERTLDLVEKNKELETAILQLKATQSQLIQSEKMASLGELTAGIAHEIQNPLNFVNNFSEVSNELIDEMNEELDNGDIEEAKAISVDIKQNLEKITHHGKRADSIVKGMLQHSSNGTGTKEPTDINQLIDEYFRLAYHGLRAKDKSFNASLVTDYDESLKKIYIIPQDIGRVILNLFTNAFYAVNERKLKSKSDAYTPTVSVITEKTNNKVIITIRDNGLGIPDEVRDKIFQPFFTTKPTGKGTGLGLSMSYDIIKAHNGNITLKTEKETFTEFSIIIPVNI